MLMTNRNHSQGFTLIELVMVLMIVAVTGTILVKGMSGLQDATRDNITRERVNQIKQAIINVQTINGTPTVSGFVADVGRLPSCIRELIDGTCPLISLDDKIATPLLWKGPYLQTSDSTFYDGWGNSANVTAGTTTDNFGWSYNRSSMKYPTPNPNPTVNCSESDLFNITISGVISVCDTLVLQSLGADGQLDNYGTALSKEYDADFPPNNVAPPSFPTIQGIPVLINSDDWIIDLAATGITVQFIHPAPSTAPTISTICNGAGSSPSTVLAGTTITSTCSPAAITTSSSSTVTCPSINYILTYTTPVAPSTTAYINCSSPSAAPSVTSTVSITCSATPASPAAPTPPLTASPIGSAGPPIIQGSATFSCSAAGSPLINTTTSIYQACAPGTPVTLLIPYPSATPTYDLYQNLISASLSPPPWPPTLPLSLCNQTNTIYFSDSASTATTPMPIGNWNICARVDATTDCISTTPLLGPTKMTVLPRTPPSVAW